MNNDTEFIVSPIYQSISVLKDDIIKVKSFTSVGLIRTDGTVIIPIDSAGYNDIHLYNNYLIVLHGQKKMWLALDLNGNPIGIENTKKKVVMHMLNKKLSANNSNNTNSKSTKKNIIPIKIGNINIYDNQRNYKLNKGTDNTVPHLTTIDKSPSITVPQLSSKTIEGYSELFSKLHQGKRIQKVVLLLTIIDLIKTHHITSPQIMPTDKLAGNFTDRKSVV